MALTADDLKKMALGAFHLGEPSEYEAKAAQMRGPNALSVGDMIKAAALGPQIRTGAGENGAPLPAPPLTPEAPAPQAAQPMGLGMDGTAGLAGYGASESATPMSPELTASLMAQRQHGLGQQAAAESMLQPNEGVDAVRQGALQESQEAGKGLVDAQQRHAEAQDALLGEAAKAAQERAAVAQQQREEMDKRIAEAQKRADVLGDQATQAEAKNFWADKSTGSRILGILAQTLSGAANGLAGTPGAETPLDRVIREDFERQKVNLATKKDAAYRAEGALGQLMKQYTNKEEARNAAEIAAYKMVGIKSDQLTARLGGAEAAPKNAAVQAAVKQNIADRMEKQAQFSQESGRKTAEDATGDLMQGQRDSINLKIAEEARNKGYLNVPGVVEPQRKELFNPAFQKIHQNYSEAFANLKTIDGELSKPGLSVESFKKTGAANALLTGNVRQLLGTGANLSAREEADLNQLILSYTKGKSLDTLTPVDARTVVGAIRDALGNSWEARVRGQFGNVNLDEHDMTFGDIARMQNDKRRKAQ